MFDGMEYVYEVYKEKSFSKAAKKLYISQPSLSASVKRIERRLNQPLFDRSCKPIRPTACGLEYIKCVEKIIDIEKGFENYINNIEVLRTGTLSLGGSNLFASYLLPPIIKIFQKRYPGVELRMAEADTSALGGMLLNGQLDLVLDNYPFSEQVYVRHMFLSETLLLAVPGEYSVNERIKRYAMSVQEVKQGRHLAEEMPAVPLKELREEPFLFLRSGNDTRGRAERICQNHGVSPRVVLQLDQQVTSYNVTCQGIGVSFVSDTLISQVADDPAVYFYKLADEDAHRNVYFYCKQGKYVTKAMREFLHLANELIL